MVCTGEPPERESERSTACEMMQAHRDIWAQRDEKKMHKISEISLRDAEESETSAIEYSSSVQDVSINAIPRLGIKMENLDGNFCVTRYAWEPAGGATLPRTKLCAVPLGEDKLVSVGGKQAEGERLEHCESFIRSRGFVKEERLVLPKSRSGFGCVALEGCVYVMGGSDGRALNKVERWCAEEKLWEVVERMGTKRDELAAAVGPDGKIYVAGGCGGADRACLASCERFDPAT